MAKSAKGKDSQRLSSPSTPQTPQTPQTPAVATKKEQKEAPEQSPEPSYEGNPYIEVLAKKVKTIKKRLAKIEKNEELQAKGHTLDADQLRSLAQKNDLLESVRELEDLQKQMEEVEAEEEKKLKKLQKKQASDEYKKIQQINEQHQENVRVVLQYLSVLNLFGMDVVRKQFVTGGVEGFTFTEHDLQTIDLLVAELYSHFDPSLGLYEASKMLHQKVNKLLNKSSDLLPNGRSFAQAMDLLTNTAASSYFNPALAKKLREGREAAEAAAEAARIADEEMQKSYEFIHHDEIPAFSHLSLEQINGLPGPQVAFINESEVLGGVQPFVAFNGSPSVYVPIPQTLYESLGVPTFGSSFRAPQQPALREQQLAQSAPVQAQQEQEVAAPQSPAEQLLLNGDTHAERGGFRGGRGGSRRGGGNQRNFQENYRSFDRAQEGTYHKSYERNHDRGYERNNQHSRSPQTPDSPKRGGANQHSGSRGRGAPANRGASRGGRQEGSSQ